MVGAVQERTDVTAVPPASSWVKVPRLVSVVCPVYREEEGLGDFAESLVEVMRGLGFPFEIIFVEDDSPDASFEVIRKLHALYPDEVKALSLSRRFGHQASLGAGFQYSGGDVVVCMDSDMQHPPSLLPLLLWRWSQGYQLVYTRRRSQRGRGFLAERASRWFYKVMGMLSDVPFEEGTADFRLMDRIVVDALNRFGERSLFYRGLVSWVGFRRVAVEYDAPARLAGKSNYTWRRMVRMAVDCLFAFSLVPLRFSYYVGGVAILGSFGYSAWVFVAWLLGRFDQPGYTTLVLLVTFMSGLNLLCLGIVGEYIGRIHEQVKGRPPYLVKEWVGFSPGARAEGPGPKPAYERHDTVRTAEVNHDCLKP
jgi:glycosyltransferase involved in cell wall biosynthesis